MQSDDYLKSNKVKTQVDEICRDIKEDDFSENMLRNLLSRILVESFNDGIISNMTERQRLSSETLRKKSKNITSYLPAHFKNSETGKKLMKVIKDGIMDNTTDFVLNIGYEPNIEDIINKTLQIAYSVGITTGFEIASDPEMKSIYTANVERFLKSGMPSNS